MKAKISLAVQIKWTTWLGRECVNLGASVTRSVSISSEGGKRSYRERRGALGMNAFTLSVRASMRSRYERFHALGKSVDALSV